MTVAICGDPEVLVIEAGTEYAVVTAGEQGPPGPPGKDAPGSDGSPVISADPGNTLTQGSDNGLYAPPHSWEINHW